MVKKTKNNDDMYQVEQVNKKHRGKSEKLMKRIEKKVDLNAHLSEIRTELSREGEKNVVSICLKNLPERESF